MKKTLLSAIICTILLTGINAQEKGQPTPAKPNEKTELKEAREQRRSIEKGQLENAPVVLADDKAIKSKQHQKGTKNKKGCKKKQ